MPRAAGSCRVLGARGDDLADDVQPHWPCRYSVSARAAGRRARGHAPAQRSPGRSAVQGCRRWHTGQLCGARSSSFGPRRARFGLNAGVHEASARRPDRGRYDARDKGLIALTVAGP